jgi:hypothetical protein
MHFITLILFFLPLVDSDTVPEFDAGGTSYYKSVYDVFPHLTSLNEKNHPYNDVPVIPKGSNVQEVSRFYDTLKYDTRLYDKQGNQLSYLTYSDYKPELYGNYSQKIISSYDQKNRITSVFYFNQSVFTSRGEYVYTDSNSVKYEYDDNAHTCSYSEMGGKWSNISARMVGGYNDAWNVVGTYSFDLSGRLMNYKGWICGRKGTKYYNYDEKGRLQSTHSVFEDCNSGFIDSIAYKEYKDSLCAVHLFHTFFPKGKSNEVALEKITWNKNGKILSWKLTPETGFNVDDLYIGNDEFHDENTYFAKYKNDTLVSEEWYKPSGEFDRKIIYKWEKLKSGSQNTGTEYIYDSAKVVVVGRIFIDEYDQSGLKIKRREIDHLDYYYGEVPQFFKEGEERKSEITYRYKKY